MDQIKVAIIDTGVELKHHYFAKDQMKFRDCYVYTPEKKEKIQKVKPFDSIGHGTCTNAMICKYAKNVLIDNFIISSSEEEAFDEERLIDILTYIDENIECNVIHLSLGITQCYQIKELEAICQKLQEKGIVLVAAYDNSGAMSYPAVFRSVIGIDISDEYRHIDEYSYFENSEINICGAAMYLKLPAIETMDSYHSVIGSSFTSPYFSAQIANLLASGVQGFESILEELKKGAKRSITNYQKEYERMPFAIHKAIVLPFNKEVHSLLRFQEMLTFEITGIYDCRFLGNVNKGICDLLPSYTGENRIIENIEQIPWEEEFDTVILGHMTKIDSITHKDYTRMVLEKCIEYKKKVYCFEEPSRANQDLVTILKEQNSIFLNTISPEYIPSYLFPKLRRFARPVLSVLGTSKRQGKFTVQMELRKRFLADEYRVGELGTEPSAYLYGMDEMVAFGYNSSLHLTNEEFVYYVNSCMARIEAKEPEIILTGSQSQTVNSYWGNQNMYPYDQHLFLLATEPDAFVLCINADDEIDYVQRTIQYVQTITCAQPVAVVIFPIRKKGSDILIPNEKVIPAQQLEERREYYESQLKIRTLILGRVEEMDELYQLCIQTFS